MDAGLIVLGTIGWTGLARLLLGSVAQFVIRFLLCSVLVVRSVPENGGMDKVSIVSRFSLTALKLG